MRMMMTQSCCQTSHKVIFRMPPCESTCSMHAHEVIGMRLQADEANEQAITYAAAF